MGSHRAQRRGLRRRPSETRPSVSTTATSTSTSTGTSTGTSTTTRSAQYAGRRVAGRPTLGQDVALPTEPIAVVTLDTPTVETPAVRATALEPAPSIVSTGTHYFHDFDVTAELPLVHPEPAPGRRKAVKHAGSRGPLFKGVPSPPLLIGVAVLAVSIGGALTANGPALAGEGASSIQRPASALSGADGVGSVDSLRGRSVSRDSSRQTLQQATGSELTEAAEAQAVEHDAALGQLAAKVQKTADELAEDRWIAPLDPVVLTARFGDYGLWSSYHTGLDFNGETGDPIKAIAPGEVTFVGYDGSYGNKTVVTLPDGTELWYCHQTSQSVSEGDTVTQGQIIGTVGATGNVTGSHLHIEVRPGGGDPVDPYPAFVQHGVTLPP